MAPRRLAPLLIPVALCCAAGDQEIWRRRLAASNTFTADPENPEVSTQDIVIKDPVAAKADESSEIVRGMVETFLHKTQLEEGELDCLVQGSGKLAGNMMTVSTHTVTLLQHIFGSHRHSSHTGASKPHYNDEAGGIEAEVDAIAAEENGGGEGAESDYGTEDPDAPAEAGGDGGGLGGGAGAEEQPPGEDAEKNAEAQKSLALFYGDSRRLKGKLNAAGLAMSASFLFMQLGGSFQQIASLARDIVGNCVNGDALEAFKLAGQHMRSMTYVEGHFLANGADVVKEMAEGVKAFEAHQHHEFGQHMGRAFRKVLLSNSTNGQLPEGLPGKWEMANVSAGLVEGFFGEGTAMDLDRKGDGMEAVHVDLHECMGDNLRFFQSVWASTMVLFAQEDMNGTSIDSQQLTANQKKAQFGTALALTMMQLPTAMQRCNISPEQEEMLADSVKALGAGTKIHLQWPEDDVSKDEMATTMAETVEAWSQMDWYDFGKDLGKLLQRFVIKMYSQKYSLDVAGILRRQLEEVHQESSRAPLSFSALACAALLAFAALFVPRAAMLYRARQRPLQRDARLAADIESSDSAIE